MFRRLFAVAAVFVFTALGALAAEPVRSRDAALPLDENALRAMFAIAPGVIQTDGDGEAVSGFAVEVVLARIDADGEIVKACVSSEEEARRFLTAPSDKLVKKEGHKQ
jgi:hypothetical protein